MEAPAAFPWRWDADHSGYLKMSPKVSPFLGLAFFVFLCHRLCLSLSLLCRLLTCFFSLICQRRRRLRALPETLEATRHRATEFSWEDYRQSLYFNSNDADKPGLSHPCLDHHLGPPKLGRIICLELARNLPFPTYLQLHLHTPLTYLSPAGPLSLTTRCALCQKAWLASCPPSFSHRRDKIDVQVLQDTPPVSR